MEVGCRVLTLSDLSIGGEDVSEFVISEADMDAFARLSGDRNPLHTDSQFARKKGFEGRVVYGALLIAKVSELIGMRLPGLDAVFTGLAVQFRAPLYIGSPATLSATVTHLSEATGAIELGIKVSSKGMVVMKGKAETLLRHD